MADVPPPQLPAEMPAPVVEAAVISPATILKERRMRLKKLQEDAENTTEVIYDHVANGGTVISLCETWDVRYCDIMKWIDDDATRKERYKNAIIARNEWADEMILAEIRAITQIDIRRLYNKNGSLKNIADLDPETARLVSSVEVNELYEGTGKDREQIGEVKKVKLWDKMKALEMAGRNRRLLVDKTDNMISLKLEDLVGRSMMPAASGQPAPANVLPAPIETTATPQKPPIAEPVVQAPTEPAK